MSKPFNPPAFPCADVQNHATQPGMTLRDYFASKALPVVAQDLCLTMPEVARTAYQIADEMLAERERAR